MTLDAPRALRALGIAAWAAFFLYLWLSGDANRYVGEKTHWVVPFGAIVLTLVATAYACTLRTSRPASRPGLRDLGGLAALIAPILLIVVVPAPSLGAQAVAKKSGNRVAVSAQAAEGRGELPLDLLDIAGAASSEEFAQLRGVVAGRSVDVTGFVSAKGAQGIQLTRFQASCCAADAIPYSVPVRFGKDPAELTSIPVDTWLQVKGTLVQDGTDYVIDASGWSIIGQPDQPYL